MLRYIAFFIVSVLLSSSAFADNNEGPQRYRLISDSTDDELMLFDTATGDIFFLDPYKRVWYELNIPRELLTEDREIQQRIQYLRDMTF